VFRDKLVYAIFDPALDCVVTVLPKGWAARERRRA